MTLQKIRQIVPANGWSALLLNNEYVTGDAEPDDDVVQALPLACWALVDDEDGESRVVGVRGADSLEIVEDDMCWIGYLGPGENINKTTRERARMQLAFVRLKVRGAA